MRARNESGASAEELVGKRVLIGITRLDHEQNVMSREHHHGCVTRIDSSIHIRLPNGVDFTLPPEPASFFPAPPGEYRLKDTGEVVVDPDYTATWTIQAPLPGGQPDLPV